MVKKEVLKKGKKKRKKKAVHKDLRKLLSIACIERDNEQCVRCGSTEKLSASHIYPKGAYPRIQYELDNVKTLCYGCHLGFWHKNPVEAKKWLDNWLPKDWAERLEYLRFNYNKLPKLDDKQLNEIHLKLCQTKV